MTVAEQRSVWSKSQVSAFKECGRKGLFSKSTKHSTLAPELISQIDRLKKLRNRHLWVSSSVHDLIAETLKSLRQGEPVPLAETLVGQLRERMRVEFMASKKEEGDRLFEHYYGLSLSKEVWQQHWNTAESSLRWFLGSKWLERLTKIGPECWKSVDDLLDFDVSGVKAYCKIDCAIEVDGRFFVMDWKTSKLRPQDELGLQTAALYAHEVWGADPDAINATAISLIDGRSLTAHVSEETMMDTFLRIEQETTFLEQKSAEATNPFSLPMPDAGTCSRCNFRQICHPQGVELHF